MRAIVLWGTIALLLPCAALGQQARPARLAIDSSASVDSTIDEAGNNVVGVIADAIVSADLGRGVQATVRPFVQRLTATGEWNRQIWVAELRYERQAAVNLRVEGGYIPSPVGLANLTLRPHLNPTASQPSSLFQGLPALEVRGPRTNLLGALYPLGAQVTLSQLRWDARVAVMDTSPLRARRVVGPQHPRFTNVVFGGGVTPFIGVHVGGSVTHGGWLRAGEAPGNTIDRDASVVTLETQVAFRHTELAAEWVHDDVEASAGATTASGWYVQGTQALTPRWFVAGRIERMSVTPAARPLEQHFRGTDVTLGFRATPELTVRVAHRGRQPFGSTDIAHTGTISLVWFRRWR